MTAPAAIPATASDDDEVRLEIAMLTDPGLVREKNEDSLAVVELDRGLRRLEDVRTHKLGARGTLLVVCDGMGGAAAGEFASQLGTDSVLAEAEAYPPTRDAGRRGRQLRTATRVANRRIVMAARWDPARQGMGTTLTAAWVARGPDGPSVLCSQVGDSRAYLVRRGEIGRLTRDQSLAEQLLQQGHVSAEEAKVFERIGIILQALGASEDVQPDFTLAPLSQGDVLLLCSDGLSGCVADEEMLTIVDSARDLQSAAAALIARARQSGAPDNVTAVLARIGGAPEVDIPAPEAYAPFELGEPAHDPLPEPAERAIRTTTRFDLGPQRYPKERAAPPPPTTPPGAAVRGLFAVGVLAVITFGVLWLAL